MKLFPVIHLGETSVDSSIEQANLAFDLDADGVYLIDHYNTGHDIDRLLRAFRSVKAINPDRYVGVNMLGLTPRDALGRIATAMTEDILTQAPNDLWVDDVRRDADMDATLIYRTTEDTLRHTTLHGGVAFKYTDTFSADPLKAAGETRQLQRYVDVVTSSGAGTNMPPTAAKLWAMQAAAAGKPIAVASGIDIRNIGEFEGAVNEVLAASSIETEPGSGVFVQEKLRDLIREAHMLAR